MQLIARHKLDKTEIDRQTTIIADRIKTEVKPHIDEMRAVQTKAAQIAAWVDKDGLAWVAKNVQAGKGFNWQDAIEEVARTRPPVLTGKKDFGLLEAKLDAALSQKPQTTLAGWLSGRIKEQTLAYNLKLAQTGETMKADAASAVKKFEGLASKTEAGSLRTLSTAHEFYAQVVAAAVDKDSAKFLAALRSFAARATPMEAQVTLLETPVSGGRSSLNMIVNAPFPSLKEEAAFLQEMTGLLADDNVSLRFLHKSLDAVTDETKKDRFRSYLSGFAGTIIPISSEEVVNANNFSGIEHKDGQLSFYNSNGSSALTWNMNAERAAPIIAAFAQRPNMIHVENAAYMNVNTISTAWYTDGKIKFHNAQGRSTRYSEASPEEAQAFLTDLSSRGDFIEIEEGEYANVNTCAAVWYTDGQLRFYNTQGRTMHYWSMPEDQARSILQAFASRSNFAAVNADEYINTNLWAAVTYEDKELRLYNGNGSNALHWKDISARQVKPVLAAYSQKPGIVKVLDNQYINPNSFAAISLQDGRMDLYSGRGSNVLNWELPREKAAPILAEIAKRPHMLSADANTLINSNSWAAALLHDGNLALYNANGSLAFERRVTAEAGNEILAGFAKRPNYLPLSKGTFVNANSWAVACNQHGAVKFCNSNGFDVFSRDMKPEAYQAFRAAHRALGQTNALKADFSGHARALSATFGSRSSQTVSHSDDGVLLPFMAAAFLLANTNTAYAGENPEQSAGFTSGEGGDFGGAGASGDFPPDEMPDGDEPLEIEADTFEAEADSGADPDSGGTDYSDGGGGTDGGGGGGGGCEISSSLQADPMFQHLADGPFGHGRQRGHDFEMK